MANEKKMLGNSNIKYIKPKQGDIDIHPLTYRAGDATGCRPQPLAPPGTPMITSVLQTEN